MTVISASRRTDIPAFYTPWFMNRLASGFCTVPNPYNAKQVSVVSLKPGDVDAIVFWTRNAEPLLPHIDAIHAKYRVAFQYTITGYGRDVDRNGPPAAHAVRVFRKLAEIIGPEHIIWRYDPIQFSDGYTWERHVERFRHIASELAGSTGVCKVSLVACYSRLSCRFRSRQPTDSILARMFGEILSTAAKYRMRIESCAGDLTRFGIESKACIGSDLLEKLGVRRHIPASQGQRPECRCVASRDIGMHESCLHGCSYCYATRSHRAAIQNHAKRHFPQSPSLLGWHEPKAVATQKPYNPQLSLFSCR